MTVLLGAIADDFTGATDLCNTLVRRGMRTVQLIDVPSPGMEVADAEAVVVALRAARSLPPRRSRRASRRSPGWSRRERGRSCSNTARPSNSTDAGNIGPVAEALMEALGTDFTLFVRLFPKTDGQSTSAICSSATCCCRNRACATTR